jgi:hypothetical protein
VYGHRWGLQIRHFYGWYYGRFTSLMFETSQPWTSVTNIFVSTYYSWAFWKIHVWSLSCKIIVEYACYTICVSTLNNLQEFMAKKTRSTLVKLRTNMTCNVVLFNLGEYSNFGSIINLYWTLQTAWNVLANHRIMWEEKNITNAL